MDNISLARAKGLIRDLKGIQIAVIGDVMLDRYFWGSVTRISPESPVPVVDIEEESFHLGGAANVANNLRSLGIEPLLCGIVGNDNSGRTFIKEAHKEHLNTSGIYTVADRPTTVKTRVIGNNQQLLRLDREVRERISKEAEKFIFDTIKNSKKLAGIIFEDYNKGTITKKLIREVVGFAKKSDIPVFTDPKLENFFEYTGVTVFKPNRREVQQALGKKISNAQEVINAGKSLLKKLKCDNILLTMGKDGMMLFEANGHISSVPTRARHVADVSGAGDTAIATLAATYSAGASIREAAAVANYAAGVVCEKPGIVSITIDELLLSIEKNNLPRS